MMFIKNYKRTLNRSLLIAMGLLSSGAFGSYCDTDSDSERKIKKFVKFNEVLEKFQSEHKKKVENQKYNSNAYAEKNLEMADTVAGGEWHKVSLGKKDILGITLPWHQGEGGEKTLVPKSGSTVKEAVKRLTNIQEEYKEKNQTCWGKISTVSKLQFTTIYLSTQAIDREEYRYLDDKYKKGRFIHLDGLHRMVSWVFNNNLTEDTKVEAYIAGPIRAYIPHSPGGNQHEKEKNISSFLSATDNGKCITFNQKLTSQNVDDFIKYIRKYKDSAQYITLQQKWDNTTTQKKLLNATKDWQGIKPTNNWK